jgi:hypothetical protein
VGSEIPDRKAGKRREERGKMIWNLFAPLSSLLSLGIGGEYEFTGKVTGF